MIRKRRANKNFGIAGALGLGLLAGGSLLGTGVLLATYIAAMYIPIKTFLTSMNCNPEIGRGLKTLTSRIEQANKQYPEYAQCFANILDPVVWEIKMLKKMPLQGYKMVVIVNQANERLSDVLRLIESKKYTVEYLVELTSKFNPNSLEHFQNYVRDAGLNPQMNPMEAQGLQEQTAKEIENVNLTTANSTAENNFSRLTNRISYCRTKIRHF